MTNKSLPSPGICTDRYKSGWEYAQWWLDQGGNKDADTPDGWHEEKCNGFFDRLALEKK